MSARVYGHIEFEMLLIKDGRSILKKAAAQNVCRLYGSGRGPRRDLCSLNTKKDEVGSPSAQVVKAFSA